MKMNQNNISAGGLDFLVRFALPNDRLKINELMLNTARWLKESGSSQWNDILEGHDVHHIEERIELGEVALFETYEGLLAGVMIIRQTPSDWDSELWGELADEAAFYLHRIMVSREFSGISLSKQMINWSEKLAISSHISLVRLDCIETNDRLNQMYRSYNFQFIGKQNGFNLYQKNFHLSK